MNLFTAISLYADADDIALAVRRVFTKKTGKGRGYEAIGSDLRSTVISEAERINGTLNKYQLSEIDSYLKTRLDFMQNTFKQLNDPMKDKSDERAARLGENENRSAQWFGRTKGWEWSGRNVLKAWVTGSDPCDDCQENEDAGPIPVGDEFPSGDYAPPAHPNCTECELEYVEAEE